jgi:hypothetical protein
VVFSIYFFGGAIKHKVRPGTITGILRVYWARKAVWERFMARAREMLTPQPPLFPNA